MQPDGRFGSLQLADGDVVEAFQENRRAMAAGSTAAFSFCSQVFDHIDGDATVFEREPLENLARDRQLLAHKHFGFWKPMDTLRDKEQLEAPGVGPGAVEELGLVGLTDEC